MEDATTDQVPVSNVPPQVSSEIAFFSPAMCVQGSQAKKSAFHLRICDVEVDPNDTVEALKEKLHALSMLAEVV